MESLRGLLQSVLLLTYVTTSFGNNGSFDEGEFSAAASLPPVQKLAQCATGCYNLHEEHVTWPKAYEACYKEGKHLVVINSASEAEVLKHLMRQHPKIGCFHVGIHSLFAAGKYRGSIFGRSIQKTGYDVWSPGEPTGKELEYCTCMNKQAQLYDILCNKSFAFVCESFL